MPKLCKVCEQEKDESDFHSLPHTTDGLNWRCKSCQSAYLYQYKLKKTLDKCHPDVLSTLSSAPIERLRRFAPKVHVSESGCWQWTGNTHPKNGYARVWFDRRDDRLAHRVSYEWANGQIPEALVLDHLCRNRSCVNPAHLQPVSNVENVMRGESVWALNAKKTHCLRGHPFDEANTRIYNGMRHCLECSRIRKRERRRKQKETRPSIT